MPELDSSGLSLDPAFSAVPPAGQVPGLNPLVARPGLPGGSAGLAILRALDGGAVSPGDVRAFDAALGAVEPDIGQPAAVVRGEADPAAPPSAAGSMAEMTAALSVYRDANARDVAHSAVSGLPTGRQEVETDVHVRPRADVAHPSLAQASIVETPRLPIDGQTSDLVPDVSARATSTAMAAQASATPADLAAPAVTPTKRPGALAAQHDEPEPAAEIQAPRSALSDLLTTAPASVVPPIAQAVPASLSTLPERTPAVDRDVAAIVQHVTRILAMRDLDALDAGREVVIRLDESLLPQTVLTFRAAPPDAVVPATGDQPGVLVSIHTQSAEVRDFLDTQGQSLIDAMAIEAPGVRWLPGDLAASTPALRRDDPLGGAENPADASRQQERGSSSNSGRGQHQGRSPDAEPAWETESVSRTDARARWTDLSRAAQTRAANGFSNAVDAGT